MPRCLTLALLALLALQAPAAAQEAPALPRARLSITPLVGVRGPLLSDRTTPLIVRGGFRSAAVALEPQRGPNAIAGAEVDLRLAGRVGVAAAVMYTNPDPFVLTTRESSDIVSQVRINGPSVWMVRAGLSYRLPEMPRAASDWLEDERTRPAGYLVAGPALLRQEYHDTHFDLPGLDSRVDSWAVHVGYRALIPVGSPNLALQVMLEDYVPFWNRDGERRRTQHILNLDPADSNVVTSDLGYDRAHIPMLTIGLAVRM